MLPLKTRSAPVPEAELVATFCSRHGLQEETLVKTAWTHLMRVYFGCNSATFKSFTLQHQKASFVSQTMAGFEQEVHLGTGTLIEDLKTVEIGSKASMNVSERGCYLLAEAQVDGEPLLSVLYENAIVPQDILATIVQVGNS